MSVTATTKDDGFSLISDKFSYNLTSSSDVEIITSGNRRIPAHSGVLASASPVLMNIIKKPIRRYRSCCGSKRVIKILGVPCDAVSVFIKFIYSSSLTEDEMEKYGIHLLALSHVYMVTQLKQRCSKGVVQCLTAENVVDVLQLARLCDAPDVCLRSMRLIHSQFKTVEQTEGWKFLQEHDPFLELDILKFIDVAESRKKRRRRHRKEQNLYMQLSEAMECIEHICTQGCTLVGPTNVKSLKNSNLRKASLTMEDADGLKFDFEGGLDSGPIQPTASVPVAPPEKSSSAAVNIAPSYDHPSATVAGAGRGRSYRQTVCRHWLRGLCMKGDACGFLHQYDKARMPVCRFFRLYGECREQDCVYKHTNEDIKECNMFKVGFCPNGPECRYRHAKLPGPSPPVEEALQKIQLTYNNGPNRFYQPRNVAPQPQDKPQVQVPMQGQPQESGNFQQQQQQQPQQSQHQVSQTQIHNSADQSNRTSHPLPQGLNRYFVVKSCNRENFELSVQQGVWATQRSNEAKLNEAFDSVENVILIFSVNRTRHFQGCAKMTSRIGGYIGGGNWKHEHGTAQYGRNFSVKWLKLCELSFHKTRNLRNPYNENLPVKISRDCQELEPSIGEELASLLYLEPDSELMAISIAAEAKREEEKAKGVNPESRAENPDIVPFEDNEEEEEEEDESEEEEDIMVGGPQGRGRGRGMMWPPQMPLGRGIRPMPGMGGFPLGVMGPADAFPYGPGGYNGMPDPFGMGPRPFGLYGPRFGGDFRGPVPGMMFPGRPPQQFPHGSYGMMGGAGRGPHMGGMGNALRGGGRPMYYPTTTSAAARPGPTNRKTPERSDDRGVVMDQQNQETSHEMEQFEVGNSLRNEESESEDEDEAPRRSRHGEGKKRQRVRDLQS